MLGLGRREWHCFRQDSGIARSIFLICAWTLSPQCSSVAQSCPTLRDPMNRSMPGLPVHHHLPEFTQTHIHWVGDAIQASRPLSPFPPDPNPSQHQSFPMSQLFAWGGQSTGVSELRNYISLSVTSYQEVSAQIFCLQCSRLFFFSRLFWYICVL